MGFSGVTMAWGEQDQTISRNVDDVTTVSYNSKISSSPWSDALGIFGLVLVNGWRPDVVSYNSSITACTKGLQWTRALSLLNELLLGRLSTTVITYGASISACERVSQWQTALSLFLRLNPRIRWTSSCATRPLVLWRRATNGNVLFISSLSYLSRHCGQRWPLGMLWSVHSERAKNGNVRLPHWKTCISCDFRKMS